MRFLLFCLFLLIAKASFAENNVVGGWGNNNSGQIGFKELQSKIIDFDVGAFSACFIDQTGLLECQGCASPLQDAGQCNTEEAPAGWVMEYGGLRTTSKPMTTVATGFGASCGINKDGKVECWGCEPPRQNFQCDIPDDVKDQKAMIPDNPLTGLKTIDVSEWHSCVVMEDGRVECWGCEESHDRGQCESKQTVNTTAVSTGYYHTCAVISDNIIECWGDNQNKEINAPKIHGKIKDIDSAYGYSSVLTEDGDIYLWGKYAPKECGFFTKENCVNADVKYKTMSASDDYLCLVDKSDKTECFKTRADFDKQNRYRNAYLKERTMPDFLKDKSFSAITVDNGTSLALIDNLHKIEKEKLPQQKATMTETEYMQEREVLPPSKAYTEEKGDFINHIGMRFSNIKKGEFLMGACEGVFNCLLKWQEEDRSLQSFETPQHKVRIGYDFQMSTFEVTIGDFKRYLEDSGINFSMFEGVEYSDDHYPVSMISWYDSQYFVDWLNKTKPERDKGTYRLASESEWEYAARAGTRTVNWQGKYLDGKNAANCLDCLFLEDPGPIPVGSFAPNPWGLYDMLGNVDEWVQDCTVEEGYYGTPNDGSPHEEPNCKNRSARGASWEYTSGTLRSAWRDYYPPDAKTWEQGLRIVRELP